MISPGEVQELNDRSSEELRELAAHIAGVLARRSGCAESAAVYHRIGDRLDDLHRRALS